MVETQARKTSGAVGIGAAANRSFVGRQSSIGHAVAYPLRLSTQQAAPRAAASARSQATRIAKRQLHQLRGEAKSVATVIGAFAFACILGIVYLGEYALVAMQGRQVHLLQDQLVTAQAQHEKLVAQYTQISNGKHVLNLAGKQNMVANAPSVYITLSAPSSSTADATQVASAQ